MIVVYILLILLINTLTYNAENVRNEARNPLICSKLTTINVEMQQLEGDWINLQSILFYRGVPIHENKPDDDVQDCRTACIRHFNRLNATTESLSLRTQFMDRKMNRTFNKFFEFHKSSKQGCFQVISDEVTNGTEVLVLGGNSTSHMIIGICEPTRLSANAEKVQILHSINLVSRRSGVRGQSIFTIQELQSQVEMLKIVELSEVQWSLPYDTAC